MSAARRISRGDTAFLKFFVGGLFVVGIAVLVGLIGRLLSIRDRWERVGTGHVVMSIVGNAALIVTGVTTIASVFRLKRVALSDAALHVSNFLREIVVPLRDVEAVDDVSRHGIDRVIITFASDTTFGRRIKFVPAGSESNPHPIVAELRAAVTGAKRA